MLLDLCHILGKEKCSFSGIIKLINWTLEHEVNFVRRYLKIMMTSKVWLTRFFQGKVKVFPKNNIFPCRYRKFL